MKRLFFTIIFILIGIINYAQTVGDFRTPLMFADGQPTAWSDPNSWERWDGVAWVVPSYAPADTNNVEIVANAYYVIDANASVNNILIEGKLAFWGNQGDYTMNISNGLIVTGEFVCIANSAWVNSDNSVTVYGDINNYGIISFYEDNGSYYCGADFILKGGSCFFNLNNGSTTNLTTLIPQKNSIDDVINFVYDGGQLGAYGIETIGFLYLYEGTSSVGTFKLSGNGTYGFPLFNYFGSEYGVNQNCLILQYMALTY